MPDKTKEIIISLWEKFPSLAKDLIERSQDLSQERNRNFFENPDDPHEHEPNWHEWGVITHTRKFEKTYREEIPKYLDRWGIADKARSRLSEKIDGISKDRLLNIAVLFHDLGKFTERKLKREKDGSVSVSFKNHEAASGKIVRAREFSAMLKQEYGITHAQIEYIARCVELHYELGILRAHAKKSDTGYTLTFARSGVLQKQARQIMLQHSDFQLEIGLLFLGDSLAKTDFRVEAESDRQIESQDLSIKDLLKRKGLGIGLVKAVKQLPVNRAVAETYLKVWAETN